MAYALPPAHLLRVWDVLLFEGYKMVFRVGIALLRSARDTLLSLDFERSLKYLNEGKYPILEEKPSVLIKAASAISVTRKLQEAKQVYLMET